MHARAYVWQELLISAGSDMSEVMATLDRKTLDDTVKRMQALRDQVCAVVTGRDGYVHARQGSMFITEVYMYMTRMLVFLCGLTCSW